MVHVREYTSYMKLFAQQTNSAEVEEHCAVLVLETIPLVMTTFKKEMRRNRPSGMTVPQLRTMLFLDRHTGESLSEVAEFLGLTLSTTSKLVDGLVKRQFIARGFSTEDRRRHILTLTAFGQETLASMHQVARARMAEVLSGLTDEERPVVMRAMQALQRLLQPGDAGLAEAGRVVR